MTIQKNSVVTVDIGSSSSNTFYVDSIDSTSALLFHPLAPQILIRVPLDQINTVSANIKDSTERCIDFANSNKQYLDYNSISDLECVGMYFSVKRKLTPRLKQILANICGIVANSKLNGDMKEAMIIVSKNVSILDDFNLMWFNNFQGLFTRKIPVTSPKQRSAIFNIAGYSLAQLDNPTTQTRR